MFAHIQGKKSMSLEPEYVRCLVRKTTILATPEERVRQNTLKLLFSRGYPQSLIVIEKKISLGHSS